MTSTVQRRLGEEAQRLQPLMEESVVRTPPLTPHPPPSNTCKPSRDTGGRREGEGGGWGGGSKNMGSL